MTIKQNGGIFGRNPEFNDVSVTDEITILENGVDVGGVRSLSGQAQLSGTTTGITFGAQSVLPTNGGSAIQNGTRDIGGASNFWRNVYVSTGVYFGSQTVATHLDDYEEGTWTPSFTASGGGSASHSRQNGRYTKIGNTVFAYFQLSASKGSLSGSVSISGLPFTSLNLNGLDAGSVSFNRVQRFVTTFNPYGHVTGDSTSIGLFKGNTNESTDATSDGVPLDAADLNTASNFRNYCFGVAIYHTA